METTTVKLYSLDYSNVKTYWAASLFIIGNILFPQLFHLIPQGGITWLPIYFFTLIGAYKYGWKVGLLTAVLSLAINSLLFSMPAPATLPVILLKSVLLAIAAGWTAQHFRRISVIMLIGVVFAYQVAGTLGEWIYIGNFYNKDNNSYLWDYNKYSTSKMSVLKRPVIAVVGLCSDVNKIDVQISVLKSLEQDGLAIKAVTNNPMGLLYDMDVFNYPKELRFPDIVYSINRYMYLTEVNVNLDAWLINIGGGIGAINIMNTYNFGKLVDAYFSAANIDVVVMCVNTYVDITNLRLQLANLYKYGIGNIFIVMSHKDIDLSTLNYKDGLQTYYVDEEKYHEAFEFLKENVEEKVFTLEDVKNGYLYTSILDTLS